MRLPKRLPKVCVPKMSVDQDPVVSIVRFDESDDIVIYTIKNENNYDVYSSSLRMDNSTNLKFVSNEFPDDIEEPFSTSRQDKESFMFAFAGIEPVPRPGSAGARTGAARNA